MLKLKLKKISKVKLLVFSTLLLIVGVSAFSLIRMYANSIENTFTSSAITDTTVYVNDLDADWYYYKSLNFTEVDNSQEGLPDGTDREIYTEKNLVPVTITYSGVDINNPSIVGKVSPTEGQYIYEYYKYYPLTKCSDGSVCIKIELLDAPFYNRPEGKGFHGWAINTITHDDGSSIDGAYVSMDKQIFTRYLNVPVSCTTTSGKSCSSYGTEHMNISLNANWYDHKSYVLGDNAAVSNYNVTIDGNVVNIANSLYSKNMTQITDVASKFADGSNMNGFYIYEPYDSSNGHLYYTAEGNSCIEAGCTSSWWVYRLVTPGSNGSVMNASANLNYYIFPSRDMNFVVANDGDSDLTFVSIVDNIGDRAYFTLTGLISGNSLNNYSIKMTATTAHPNYVKTDMAIDNLKTYNVGVTSRQASISTTTAAITAQYHNLKIGRNFTGSSDRYGTAIGVVGGSNYGVNNVKFKVIVESGMYNYFLQGPTTDVDARMNGYYIYGSDYDRVALNNSKLTCRTLSVGQYFGDVYGTSSSSIGTNVKYKSGNYGTYVTNDNSSGVYAGARNNGTAHCLNVIKIEGGEYTHVIGGPSVEGVETTTGIYVTGGEIGFIFGGAANTTTIGNRVVSVTGGVVTNNIFGGSNSYNGNGQDGRLDADTFVYVGGNAEVGGTGATSSYNAMPGSVFGAGAGKAGADFRELGTVGSATIVLNDEAVIHGDLYGGGNYGTTGRATADYSETRMNLLGGEVKGNVFGSSNNNGSGRKEEITTAGFSKINYYNIVYKIPAGQTIPTHFNLHIYQGGGAGYTCNGGFIADNMYFSSYCHADAGGHYRDLGSHQVYFYNQTAVTQPTVCNSGTSGWTGDGCYVGSLAILAGEPADKYKDLLTTYVHYWAPVVNNNQVQYTDVSWSLPNDITTTKGDEAHTIRINQNGTNVNGSIYAGANSAGTVFANIVVDLKGGTVAGDVFGGGLGAETYISGSITVNVDGIISPTTDVYGGSAYGFVGYSNESDAAIRDPRTTKVNINSGQVHDVYGGSMGSTGIKPLVNTYSLVTMNGGNVTSIYGGSNVNADTSYRSKVLITGGTAVSVYGGSNRLGSTLPTEVVVEGGIVYNLFGGSNETGDTVNNNVFIKGGQVFNAYGGNNAGGIAEKNKVSVLGGNVGNVYGCGKGSGTSCELTNVLIENINDSDSNIYGGGEEAPTEKTKILINSGLVGKIFGGNNKSGIVQESNVYLNGGTANNVYGGNDVDGHTVNANVFVGAGNHGSIYGGGYQAYTKNSYLAGISGAAEAIYGGGHNAAVENPTLNIHGGDLSNVFGGSNENGTINNAVVNVGTEYVHVPEEVPPEEPSDDPNTGGSTGGTGGNNSNIEIPADKKAIMDRITFSTTVNQAVNYNQWFHDSSPDEGIKGYPFFTEITINYNNPTGQTLYAPFNIVIRYEKDFAINTTQTFQYYFSASVEKDSYGYRILNDCVDQNNCSNGQLALRPGNNNLGKLWVALVEPVQPNLVIAFDYQVNDSDFERPEEDDGSTDVPTDSSLFNQLFVKPEFVVSPLVITNVYGGNNAGGKTINSIVNIYGSTVAENVYGGGKNAATDYTQVNIYSGAIGNVYGGGEGTPAIINHNTDVIIRDGTIGNVYGGGNAGNVVGETLVSLLNGSVSGSVFGSGNAASTGLDGSSSLSTVNLFSGSIGGNVYGGANSSVVNGSAKVNIGANVINDNRFTDADYGDEIVIKGTVFGGSESNADGDENYDFNAISVTQGIYINIDPTSYNNFELEGSVFGSGNASSSQGDSIIRINNMGTKDKILTMTSIQRAKQVYLTNSNIQLVGTTDSTSSHSKIKYTFNIIDHLYLLDNTSIYLRANANLLQNMTSGKWSNDDIEIETVNIHDSGAVSQNVNNRLYIIPSKALNVLKTQDVDENFAGNVKGMAFLGMYGFDETNKTANVGIYDTTYRTGNVVSDEVIDMFRYSGTYVYGKHYENHDITKDGFYSNYFEEETNKISVEYVEPSPKSAKYYMWVVGIKVTSYEITLEASRYSTLGVKNLALTSFDNPDTKFRIEAFTHNDLKSGVNIIDSGNIPKVADSGAEANSNFGLAVGNGNIGWKNDGLTNLYTGTPSFSGTTEYETESTVSTPILSFYFYHSKNIELEEDEDERQLGDVRLILTAIAPQIDDEVTSDVSTVEVVIHLVLTKYDEDGYGAAMAPGKKYSVFPSVKTNIAANASLSLYHTLYLDLNKNDKNDEPWSVNKLYPTGAYRALSSTIVYPVGTTITMIDLVDNEYYYYTVTSENIASKETEYNSQNQVSYYLRDFIKMDSVSTNNNYDDAVHNSNYYHSDGNYAFEEFIFIVDFAGANITSDYLSESLYLELRDPNKNHSEIIRPLGDAGEKVKYNVYANSEASIINSGSFSDDSVYVGELTTINLSTIFNQDDGDTGIIYDSTFDDYKLGAKITVYDKNGLKLDGGSLLGLTFVLDGKEYYPQTDGTTRINLSGKVANVNSAITVDTAGSGLSNGEYVFRIEAFGSYDGFYYSDKVSNPLELKLTLMNNMYGLEVNVADESVIHDKDDGYDVNGNRYIEYTIDTTSGLDNPNLRVSLQRRIYTNPYDMTYELVNLQDYVEETLVTTSAANDYLVSDQIPGDANTMSFGFTLKNTKLKTGTYRVRFSMYDGDTYIGSIYKYLIIRDM